MPPDKILLNGMTFYGFHGNSAAEQELGQRILVDVEIHRDLRAAGLSDDLGDTVNYSRIYRMVKEIVEGRSRKLLENVAEAIAGGILCCLYSVSSRSDILPFGFMCWPASSCGS